MPETEIKRREVERGCKFSLEIEEEEVSGLKVIDYLMTYGQSTVRMAGIAGVNTHSDYRRRGFASRVIQRAVEWMINEGYHCSLLFGIPDFYWRFGYSTVLSDSVTEVLVRDAEKCPDYGYELRPLVENDLDEIRRLYNQNIIGRCCGLLRRSSWSGFRRGTSWNSDTEAVVALDSGGAVVGYGISDGESESHEVKVCEVETADPRSQGALLKHFAGMAVERREKKISFLESSRHPFSVFCRRFGAIHRERIARAANGMARLCDLKGFMNAVQDELSFRSRLLSSNHQGRVLFKTDLGNCTLVVKPGRVKLAETVGEEEPVLTISAPQKELVRLIFGVTDLSGFMVGENVELKGKVDILPVLFPQGPGTIPLTEHF